MEVRTPTMARADEIAALWTDLAREQRQFGSHLLPDPGGETVRESVARRIVAGELLVAVCGDDVVGFVGFEVATDGHDRDLTRGVVRNVYVVPERRSEGVGGELLAAAERRLRDRDVDAVALQVLADNEAARRFYRRHGYRPHRVELEKPAGDCESATGNAETAATEAGSETEDGNAER